MEITIGQLGQTLRSAHGKLEQAKAVGWKDVDYVPESDELYTLVVEAYAELDAVYCALMDLSKAINPEPSKVKDLWREATTLLSS